MEEFSQPGFESAESIGPMRRITRAFIDGVKAVREQLAGSDQSPNIDYMHGIVVAEGRYVRIPDFPPAESEHE